MRGMPTGCVFVVVLQRMLEEMVYRQPSQLAAPGDVVSFMSCI